MPLSCSLQQSWTNFDLFDISLRSPVCNLRARCRSRASLQVRLTVATKNPLIYPRQPRINTFKFQSAINIVGHWMTSHNLSAALGLHCGDDPAHFGRANQIILEINFRPLHSRGLAAWGRTTGREQGALDSNLPFTSKRQVTLSYSKAKGRLGSFCGCFRMLMIAFCRVR